ncbi:MAG TPA: YihY/virulence factor BrkB family protein [Pyrinomonadaceae bacterium]|nr:YihY/virulence factor BrkB family protein [Pyrinomonadaceae bacterium]
MFSFDLDWKVFFSKLWDRILETDIFDRSAQTAFFFTFALFPLLFFIVSSFGLIIGTTEVLREELFGYLHRLMPTVVYTLVSTTLLEIVKNSSSTKVVLGLAAALWAASAGVDGIRSALNAVYSLKEHRSWWQTKLQSVLMTLLMIFLVGGVLLVVFYAGKLTASISQTAGVNLTSLWIVGAIQWITIVAILLVACELIYNLLPAFQPRRWIWLNAGSVIAILSWIALTGAFRLYLQYFNSYDRTYGSLGAVIVTMLWLYFTAMSVMIGGIINVVLSEMKQGDEPRDTVAESISDEKPAG